MIKEYNSRSGHQGIGVGHHSTTMMMDQGRWKMEIQNTKPVIPRREKRGRTGMMHDGGKDEGKDRSRRRSEAIKDRKRDKGTSKELDTGHATCTYTVHMHITKRREMERGREK